MRVYMGFRLGGMTYVYWWDARQPARPVLLDPRMDLWGHSPTGFEWGYEGSGPAQLALALAADCCTDSRRAVAIHQRLKRALVSRLDRDCWSVTRDQVCALIVQLEEERDAREEVAGEHS